ncbi:hypothetical protein ACIP98_31980 [Streptomyces sp. NPDC088354]|uniref:hypothetical protein n=1 Tax=Streptomyces sp. NPDC088354 TaxID=3365856 RepID=UPI00381E34BF
MISTTLLANETPMTGLSRCICNIDTRGSPRTTPVAAGPSSLQEAVGLLEHEVAVLRGQMEGLYAEAPAGAPALAEGAWGITQAQAGEGAQGDVLARLPRRSPVSSPTLTRINVP